MISYVDKKAKYASIDEGTIIFEEMRKLRTLRGVIEDGKILIANPASGQHREQA